MPAPGHPPASRSATGLAGTSPLLAALLAALLGLAVLYYLAFNLYFITLPGAQEGREAAIPITTALLLAGGSPYQLSHLPAIANLYGVVYNGSVLPFAALFGPTYAVHRSASLFFLLAGAALIFRILRSANTGPALALAAAAFYYLLNATTYALAARPDALGELLFLATVSLVTRTPGQSPPSLARLTASATLGLLAFYTKPYFVLGLALAAVAVACQSGIRRAIVYAALAGSLLLITLLLTVHFWPYYLFTIFTVNRFNENDSFAQLLSQFFDFTSLHAGLLLALACATVPLFLRRATPPAPSSTAKNLTGPRFDPWSLNLLLAALAVILILGRHGGSFRAYWVQLITPLLLIVTIRAIAQVRAPWRSLGLGCVAFNAVILLTWARPNWPIDSAPAWAQWSQLTAGRPLQLVLPTLLDPVGSPGTPVIQDGQTVYFINAALNTQPADSPLHQRVQQYLQNLANLIQQRRFDVIVLPNEFQNLIPPGLLAQHYQLHRLSLPCYFYPYYDPAQYGAHTLDYAVWLRQPGPAHAPLLPSN